MTKNIAIDSSLYAMIQDYAKFFKRTYKDVVNEAVKQYMLLPPRALPQVGANAYISGDIACWKSQELYDKYAEKQPGIYYIIEHSKCVPKEQI